MARTRAKQDAETLLAESRYVRVVDDEPPDDDCPDPKAQTFCMEGLGFRAYK